MAEPGFWDDQSAAQNTVKEISMLKRAIEAWTSVFRQYEDAEALRELVDEEPDEGMQAELEDSVEKLETAVSALELSALLDGEYDSHNAILSIHPGAGGTESQDWASMLLRMYTRWADSRGYTVETLDYQPGDEAGIKSVTLLISGMNAYGYLRAEKGVHRLVRISPFDASGRRHTSFSSVDVLPEITDEETIEIRPDDLRIDTYRASGAGGQHVNKTDSAIRITHIPTGIVVQCQSERSQHANREAAMKILRARLAERREQERQARLMELKGEQGEIAWGNQIRSYVFCPYTLVKDHRTNVEIGNVEAVMDGMIDPFIEAYLKMKK
jgi:peptide chain release factor 2